MRLRVRGIATAAVLVMGAVASAPSPAAAWTTGACPTTSGVTIVVDFTAFGAGVVTRCAAGSPRTGFDVLTDAGFTVEQVQTMAGFVCRIDGRPGAGAESCVTTPPANASWSYWHAERGGSWTYNPVGAGGSRPAAGSVEGWAFMTGGPATPPGIAPPPPPAAPTASPVPTPTQTPVPTRAPTAPPVPASAAPATPMPTPTSTLPATGVSTPSAAATVMATPTGSATATPTTSESATPVAAPAVVTPAADDRGSLIGTLAGVGLLVLLGGAAVVAQRRGGRAPA